MLPVPVVSDGAAAAAASVRGGFAIITRPVIQNGPWVAAHITRLTRVKTNPLGNELEWELPWLVDEAKREGNSRAAGGRREKELLEFFSTLFLSSRQRSDAVHVWSTELELFTSCVHSAKFSYCSVT